MVKGLTTLTGIGRKIAEKQRKKIEPREGRV
jgi:hypothetical protein